MRPDDIVPPQAKVARPTTRRRCSPSGPRAARATTRSCSSTRTASSRKAPPTNVFWVDARRASAHALPRAKCCSVSRGARSSSSRSTTACRSPNRRSAPKSYCRARGLSHGHDRRRLAGRDHRRSSDRRWPHGPGERAAQGALRDGRRAARAGLRSLAASGRDRPERMRVALGHAALGAAICTSATISARCASPSRCRRGTRDALLHRRLPLDDLACADAGERRALTRGVALDYLACGLDPGARDSVPPVRRARGQRARLAALDA